jgi:sugar O-acyltransferase (sialic acid O-acetyltransferase NeuD family)
MADIVFDNKIAIFGKGDLAYEFSSSSNFDLNNTIFIDKDLDDNLDYEKLKSASKIYIAISDSFLRESIFERLKNHNLKPDSYISNKAFISKNVKIGAGSIIQPNCIISNNVTIGNLVFINFSCIIGHDVFINDYSSMMPSVNIGGHASIGKNVFMGTSSTILPNKKIVDNVKIGAGSVLISSARKEGTYFGNPASRI